MLTKDELLSTLYPVDELLAMHRSGDEKVLDKLLIKYGLRTSSILIRSIQKPEIEIHYEQIQGGHDDNLWRIEFGDKNGVGLTPGETSALDVSSMLSAPRKSDEEVKEPLSAYIPDHIGIAPFPRIASLAKLPQIIDIRKSRLAKANLFSGGGFNVDRLSYPWCTIGKIITTGRYELPGMFQPFVITRSGTACVVGRNVVLTASHVFPWGATDWSAQFIPASGSLAPTAPFGVFNATSAYGYPNSEVNGYDITALRMDRPVGDITGWMGFISDNDDDDLYYKASWYSMGYPDNYQLGQDASLEFSIKVQDVDNDDDGSRQIETPPFTNSGWSGGPLFSWFREYNGVKLNGPCVAGTLSGREQDWPDPTRAVFAGGNALARIITYGRNNW